MHNNDSHFNVYYIAGMDYNTTAPVFNVTISAGVESSSFDIDIIDDLVHEDIETFTVIIRLLPSSLSLSLCISSCVVRIIDNDSKQLYIINVVMYSNVAI